jgi:RNA polymerase sigma-70 factor (ECF subfamily)
MTDRNLRDRAVDQAYRDHATEVFRVAYGILRDPDEALDATHDAFARAWERWEQYDSQRPVLAWLHGIVAHLALDQLRRRRVRRLVAPALARAPIGRPGTGIVEDPASDVVRRQVVDAAIGDLKPQARAALVLRHYYGYDYAQIGTFLGMGSGTVGSVLSRAHAVLRQRLGDQADEIEPHRSTPNHESVATPPEVLP